MKCIKLVSLLTLFLLSFSIYSQKLKVIEATNLDLNSGYAEIGIKYLKNNTILFASSRKNNSGKKRDKRNNRHMGLRLYTGSIVQNGEVANVTLFSEAENNPINESNITFTTDYKTVYFTRNNYIQDDYRKQFKKDTFDSHILRLFKASINSEGVMSNITPLPINNASYSVTNPQLSPNNKKLYFISDMKSSHGGFDIYEMDIHADGTYGTPKNLGTKINSKGAEMFPFVTADNILYYASDGHGGLGELDIFSIDLGEENAKPINLGSPINSNRDDFSFIYNPNNLIGYFASNRKGGNGGADLYSFTVEPPFNETIEEEKVIALSEDSNSSEVSHQITQNAIEDSTIVAKSQSEKSENDSTDEAEIVTQNDAKESNSLVTVIAASESSDSIKNEQNQQDKTSIETEQEDVLIEPESTISDEKSPNNENATISNESDIENEKLPEGSKKPNAYFAITSNIITTDDNVNKNKENELLLLKENTEENREEELIANSTDSILTHTSQDTILNSTNSTPKAIAVIASPKEKKIEKCIQIIEGFIMNPSNATLNNATVTIYENGENIGTFDVGSDGKYHLELKCNYHYRITARLNKFEETYFELRTNQFSGTTIATNIVMEKIPCDILITGIFRDSKTNAPISNVKLYLIQNNEQVKATATKTDGSYSFKANCDEIYQINTDKFGYEEDLFDINKSKANNSTVAFNASLKPLKCVQVLNGRITDLNTGQPLINATVELIDKKGDLKETAFSNTNGNYHFTIDCDEKYTVNVSNKLFEFASSEFKATTENKQVNRLDIPLKSLACIQTIDGIVLNTRTKVPMGNVVVNLLKEGLVIKTKISPNSGIFSFEVDCETNYSIAISSKDFYDNSKEVVTSNVRNATIDFSIKIESKLDFDLVRGEMMILIEPIDFDLNKSEIREDAAIELTKIVNAMTKNKNISVDIGVHTDSRAPDTYNMTLSEERAQSIMRYIVSRGIDANRLTGKGYGETQLLNKCSNGVKCTEEEHLLNRRIEFKVIQ